MLKLIKKNLFSFNFRCVRCGNCCTHLTKGVPLFYSDVKRIADYKKLNLKDFLLRNCDLNLHEIIIKGQSLTIPGLYLKTFEHTCVFYKDYECLIQKVKPYLCEHSPFISLLFQDSKNIQSFKEYCKGFGQGIYYNKETIRELLEKEIEIEKKELQIYNAWFYDYIKKVFNIGEKK